MVTPFLCCNQEIETYLLPTNPRCPSKVIKLSLIHIYLRRTRAGRFSLADCVTLEEIQQAREQGNHMALLRPVDSLFACYPALYLGEKETLRCKNGAENAIPGMPEDVYKRQDWAAPLSSAPWRRKRRC